MIAFPGLLIAPAQAAGIAVPKDVKQYDPEDYPHFHLFCCFQIGRRMPTPTSHWENARLISKVPLIRVKTITIGELVQEFGIQAG